MSDDFFSVGPPESDSDFLNDLLFTDDQGDQHAQDLFDDAIDASLTDAERDAAYDELCDYMWDVYGLNFEDAFDWEAFREWYE